MKGEGKSLQVVSMANKRSAPKTLFSLHKLNDKNMKISIFEIS